MNGRLTVEPFEAEYEDGSEGEELVILLDGEPIATMDGTSPRDVALANWLCTADPAKCPE